MLLAGISEPDCELVTHFVVEYPYFGHILIPSLIASVRYAVIRKPSPSDRFVTAQTHRFKASTYRTTKRHRRFCSAALHQDFQALTSRPIRGLSWPDASRLRSTPNVFGRLGLENQRACRLQITIRVSHPWQSVAAH